MPFLLLAYRSGMSAVANKHFARKKISLKMHNKRGLEGEGFYSLLGMADTHSYFWHLPSCLLLNSYKLDDKHITNVVLVEEAFPN